MKKSRAGALCINLFLMLSVFFFNCLYQTRGFTLLHKTIASSLAALMGIFNCGLSRLLRAPQRPFYLLMAAALLLCLAGDVLIVFSFPAGAASFALGHLLFFSSGCLHLPFQKRDGVCILPIAIFSCAFLLFFPYFRFDPSYFQFVCLLYGLIISLMLGKSLSNLLSAPSTFSFLFFFGSLLFYGSDLLLSLSWFAERWDWTGRACMAAYYPALCLIALSMHPKTFHSALPSSES